MKQELAIIYRLELPDGRFYIGVTMIDLQRRLKLHRDKAYRENPSQRVHKAIRASGVHLLLKITPLKFVARDCRFSEEAKETEAARAEAPDLCLNDNTGSVMSPRAAKAVAEKNRGKKLSEETKAKMSLSRAGNKNALGLVHSQEFRDKMRQKATTRIRANGRFT